MVEMTITFMMLMKVLYLKGGKILIDESRIKDIMSYVFILDNDKIQEEVIDGSIVFERW